MDLFTLSASLGLDISGFKGGIDTARRLLLQLAKVVVDFGQDVIETGMGFDKQMSAVQAVMGLTENTAENLATMNGLREFALEQARDSIFTAEETATAYYYMGMAGWRAEQMTAGLPGVMALAAASGEDLKMTSDMVTDSLTAFGYEADQATHFADVLAVTATNSNTDVARMQQTFKNLAPIAGVLGYSIEDVALSVGLMANAGIKGSQAGTALRNIFTRIATNAGATSNTLGALSIITDKLGVSFYDAEGKARDWGDILTEVRAAWAGMDEETREGIIRDFDSAVESSEEAKIALKEFTADVEKVQDIQSKLAKQKDGDVWDRYASQIGEIGKQYDALLIKLDIPIPKQPEEYADALEQARIKLGLMSDQEQIYYGKQIGSLRGIAGWLALITASEANVRQLTNAIENADGAAQAMADTRLDNLWGDITRFNAELDVLKIALYDDIKSPLRDVVQWATSALKDVTNAINENGLAGGIDKLSEKIRELADDEHFKNLLSSIGKLAVPVLDEVLNDLAPSLIESASKIINGFLGGMGDAMVDGGDGVGGLLGVLTGIAGSGIGLAGKIVGLFRTMGKNSGSAMADEIAGQFDPEIHPENIVPFNDWISAGNDPTMIPDSILSATEEKAPDISSELYGATQEAAESGSADFQDIFGSTSNAIADDLASSIGGAGTDAGNVFGNNMQAALDSRNYAVNVTANVSGLPINYNASAMSGGRIYRTTGIFGYANGALQAAGDVGAEAVVGVNSLKNMIDGAVRNAVNSSMSGATINIYQQPGEDEIALANRIEKVLARQQRQRRAATA